MLASWPEGLNRMTCSPAVGGSHSRSAPARKASHGSHAVVSFPVFTCARGGDICMAAMRFSSMRERAAKSFMAPMVAPRAGKCSFKGLYGQCLQTLGVQ